MASVAAAEHVRQSHGHPFRRAHRRTSRWPSRAAYVHVDLGTVSGTRLTASRHVLPVIANVVWNHPRWFTTASRISGEREERPEDVVVVGNRGDDGVVHLFRATRRAIR